jgi:hypothetical protein
MGHSSFHPSPSYLGVKATPRNSSPNTDVRTVWNVSPAGGDVALRLSVISMSLSGSAPWSPLPLTVDVTAQMETVPGSPVVSCEGVGLRHRHGAAGVELTDGTVVAA